MLAQQFPDFGQRDLVNIVVGEAQPVARRERVKRECERRLQNRQILSPLRIEQAIGSSVPCRYRFGGVFSVTIFERLRAARAANLVDMPLRKDGTEPGGELAATMKVVEERLALASGLPQAVQLRVQRVGELAAVRFSCNRARRPIKLRPKLRDKEIPRRGGSC